MTRSKTMAELTDRTFGSNYMRKNEENYDKSK